MPMLLMAVGVVLVTCGWFEGYNGAGLVFIGCTLLLVGAFIL